MIRIGQALFFALLYTSACAEEYPDDPTWNDEIALILTANCARCHGENPVLGAPPQFRLDQYDDAVEFADRIRARAIDYEETGVPQMPPDSYLTNDQKEVLEQWLDSGTPLGD